LSDISALYCVSVTFTQRVWNHLSQSQPIALSLSLTGLEHTSQG